MGSNGVQWGPKNIKNWRKTGNSIFSQNRFFDNFKLNMGGLGVSGGMAWTMRTDSLEVWRDLVLHGMGELDFHVFWKYWKLTSSPNTSKLVLGPPDWSSGFLGEWRTRYLLGVAHTIFFGSGAHDFVLLGPMGPGTTRGQSILGTC